MPLENKYFKKMIGLLPWYERESSVYQELFKSVSTELQREDLNIEDIEKQFDLNKATWGLVFWEIPYGIVPKNESDYDSRRTLIKSKQQGYGKSDASLLKEVIKIFTGYDAEILFNGKIIINFNESNDIDLTNPTLINEIEIIKPAHLGLDFQKINKDLITIKEEHRTLKVIFPITNETKTVDKLVHSDSNYIFLKEQYKGIMYPFNKCGDFKSSTVSSNITTTNIQIQSE